MSGDLQIILLVVALGAAMRWAGWPERAAALLALGSHALDRYYHWAIGGQGNYQQVDLGHLTIDLYLLAGFLAIALKADRQWTLWVAGAQIVALLSHRLKCTIPAFTCPTCAANHNLIRLQLQLNFRSQADLI